jgi:group I intron endonuclease
MKNVIYKIEILNTNKFYIGSAVNFKARKRIHLHQFRNNKHANKYMQRIFNKHGEDIFLFSIVEFDIAPEKLIEREQYFIDFLKPDLNLCRVAGSRLGQKLSAEQKENLKGKRIGIQIHTIESKSAIVKALLGNTYSKGKPNRRKVTEETYKKVIELRTAGLGCRKIAAIVGLNKTTILNIFNNKFNYGYN